MSKPLTSEELAELESQLSLQKLLLDEREARLIEREKEQAGGFASEFARSLEAKETEIQRKLQEASVEKKKAHEMLERAREVAADPSMFYQTMNDTTQMEQIETLASEVQKIKEMMGNQSMSSASTLRVTVKDALAYLPSFDGINMSVSQFIRACARAQSMLPEGSEEMFLILLRQKFTGNARTAVKNSEYHSLDALETRLRDIFDPYRTRNQCKADLENIVMAQNEKMIDYVNRVQTLHGDILHAEKLERGGELLASERRRIERDALDAFLNGIPPILRISVKQKSPVTLEEAYQMALLVSKSHDRDLKRFGQGEFTSGTNNNTASVRMIASAVEKNNGYQSRFPVAKCEYCGRMGHERKVCWRRQNDEEKAELQKEKKVFRSERDEMSSQKSSFAFQDSRNRVSCLFGGQQVMI